MPSRSPRRGHTVLPVLLACASALALAAASPASAATLPAGFDEVTLASGLSTPTTVDWAPDGRMFVAELTGRIKVRNPGSSTLTTIATVPTRNQGLTGLSVDKDFASNGLLWVAYTEGFNGRVARLTVAPDNTASGLTTVLGKVNTSPCPTPSNTSDCLDARGSHVIDHVLSDPRDGTLWISNGDGASASSVDPESFFAYREDSLAGKILHVDRDGKGLPGHPYCPAETDLTKVCTKVWATGLRNPFRFALHPDGTSLVVGNVGWTSREEIEQVRVGRNHGWPCYEGDIRTPGYRDLPECATEYAKEGTSAAAVAPLLTYARPGGGAAITGGPVYPSTGTYPTSFDDSIFYGDYVLGFIRRRTPAGTIANFATGVQGITDLRLSPAGNLVYVDSDSGVVREIRYVANQSPIARASANRTFGPVPLSVAFHGSDSSDPDGGTLTYSWSFGDGTTSTQANPAKVYADGSTDRVARLTVTDEEGASDSAELRISPGNTPPSVSISGPSTWRAGQDITLGASATDPEQGTLPASAYVWAIRLIHIDHMHPADDATGVTSTTFTTQTEHDADSYYEATVTVTDARGQTATATRRLDPETRRVQLDSAPSGATVTYAGADHATPFDHRSPIGFETSISTGATFTSGGQTYEFVRWSDGVTQRLRSFTVPDADTSLTAEYRAVEVTGTTIEAETMNRSVNTGIVGEAGTSGGQSVRLFRNTMLTTTRTLPAAQRITVRAKGEPCNGAPVMVARIDGAEVLRLEVPSTTYADHTATIDVPAGARDLAVGLVNDLYVAGQCDRNLVVDAVTLSSIGDPGGGDDETPPAAPSGLTATGGDGQVTLNWSDNSETDLAGYRVYRGTAAGGPYGAVGSGLVFASAFTDTGRTNGTTYRYVVRAEDAAGNLGPASAEVSATPEDPDPPPPPPPDGDEVTFEGEAMTAAAATSARPMALGGASGGQVMRLFRTTTIRRTAELPAIEQVVVRARGYECAGPAIMAVTVAGVEVLRTPVAGALADHAASVDIPAGTHEVTVALVNDLYRSATCDRNLDVDTVRLVPPSGP